LRAEKPCFSAESAEEEKKRVFLFFRPKERVFVVIYWEQKTQQWVWMALAMACSSNYFQSQSPVWSLNLRWLHQKRTGLIQILWSYHLIQSECEVFLSKSRFYFFYLIFLSWFHNRFLLPNYVIIPLADFHFFSFLCWNQPPDSINDSIILLLIKVMCLNSWMDYAVINVFSISLWLFTTITKVSAFAL